MKAFNVSFLWHNDWNVATNKFGARDLIIGTVVTSFGAILISAPLSIAIGLFLSELAPPSIRGPIGTLIDMLAAVPSVVVGLWGIFVLAPFDAQHVQPFLGETLGWIPIFAHGQDKVESTVFTAIVVLTIMTIPITSSICRELFLGVPEELEEASLGLGATRWEMVKTVVVPTRARRRRRRDHPRPRPRARRGDRRHAGDRQLHPAQAVAARARRHAREPRRQPVPGRDDEHPDLVADLPRRSSCSRSRSSRTSPRSGSSSGSSCSGGADDRAGRARRLAARDRPVAAAAAHQPRRRVRRDRRRGDRDRRARDPRLVGVQPRRQRAQLGLLHEGAGRRSASRAAGSPPRSSAR